MGEGTPLYKPYRYVPPQRVGFLALFDLTMGINFAHFGLEFGMVFKVARLDFLGGIPPTFEH